MVAVGSTGRGKHLGISRQPARQIVVLTSNSVLVSAVIRMVPDALAVKMHTLVFCSVQSGIVSCDRLRGRVELFFFLVQPFRKILFVHLKFRVFEFYRYTVGQLETFLRRQL